MKKFITAAVIATLAISSPASAAVNFNAADYTGTVGKGDVQLAFGWNNAAMQRNLSGVTFGVTEVEEYAYDCVWFTGGDKKLTKKRHEVTKKAKLNSVIAIEYTTKGRVGQMTGFIINGGTETSSGTAPVEGEACLGDGASGTIEAGSVELVSSTNSGLQVSHGGITHDLPNTPVAPVV